MEKTCEWKQDGGEGNDYATDCQNMFTFIDDGPAQNGFEFCPYCGGRLTIQNEADS